jgi:hypothetical protein
VEGLLGGNFDGHPQDFDGAGLEEGDATPSHEKVRSRTRKLHDQKLSAIQESHFDLLEMCKNNRTLTDEYFAAQEELKRNWRGRAQSHAAGRPSVARIRGRADAPKSSKKRTCESASEVVVRKRQRRASEAAEPPKDSLPMDWLTVGLESSKARNHLRKMPKATEGWVVEVYPDKESKKRGERWFTTIVDGSVSGSSGAKTIKACRWLMTNSVSKVATKYAEPVSIEIKSVKAYGPRTSPMYATCFQ